ncbi:hypothetical protein KGB51_gp33 [Escherichia phage C1]|uniref:Uncharacterized protein n=1 Tax=Escherichia phage C1 TaxID=2340716 RepID=A0A3G3M771_9CAUD|nr:hypothetical protein KGB51_gp33 [Escherichia phage C1]AYR02281.1 hypothetical protein [Escherichia phage C1]URP83724.1 hypothetical protein [Escherichia phage S192]
MRWAIKHKSGRTLFVTSDEFIASNRRKMGWIVEEVKMTSREQFEKWVKEETGFDLWRTEYPMTEWDNQQYKCHQTNLAWLAWQASRAAIEIECPGKREREAFSTDFEDGVAFGYNDAMDAYELAIQQAGLKVKK